MAKVVIAGAGALGSLFGALLAEAGVDVVLIARGAHSEAMRARGLRLLLPDGSERTVSVDVAERAAGEFVLLTTKAFDAAAVVDRLVGEPRLAASFQNGLSKDEALIQRFGPSSVTGTVTMAAAEILNPGTVMCSSLGMTYLGGLVDGRSNEAAEELATLLAGAGLPVDLVDDIESVEWSKLAAVCGLMALQLISGRFVHEVLRQFDSGWVMKAVATEVGAIAQRRGVELRDWPGLLPVRTLVDGPLEDATSVLRAAADKLEDGGATRYRTSLLQDYARGGRTELDLIHGAMIDVAVDEGVLVPSLETCYRLCRLVLPPPE